MKKKNLIKVTRIIYLIKRITFKINFLHFVGEELESYFKRFSSLIAHVVKFCVYITIIKLAANVRRIIIFIWNRMYYLTSDLG